MRVISFNANGLRSATRKGFFSWFSRQRADVLCVQELKAQAAQLQESAYHQKGFHRTLFEARRPGYSGVAIYSRSRPKKIIKGLGKEEFDAEGRYLEAIFENVAVVSVYLPSGSSGEIRQQAKFRFLDFFEKHLVKLRRRRLPYILCGDFNDTPLSYAYNTIINDLNDSFSESGKGIGRSFVRIPALRIDYILHDKKFSSFNYKQHKPKQELSDHYAISTELSIP